MKQKTLTPQLLIKVAVILFVLIISVYLVVELTLLGYSRHYHGSSMLFWLFDSVSGGCIVHNISPLLGRVFPNPNDG
jgi:hypothetical protein